MLAVAALAILVLGAAQVAAHGGALSYSLNGETYQGFVPFNSPRGQTSIQREWDTYNPLTDPTDSFLSCNSNGANLGSGQLSATVPAGAKVIAYWNQWPHTIGPVMVYMASCNDACTSAITSSLEWFKIDEADLISGDLPTGLWGMGELLLAIHTSDQPQFYPECAQLKVTGSGSAQPSGSYLVKFPGAYSMSDPGVGIDVYSQPGVTNYTISGPAVWQG